MFGTILLMLFWSIWAVGLATISTVFLVARRVLRRHGQGCRVITDARRRWL